ncbi:MAG: bifunctional N-acetylglucosamine-1-phosphate uridyltransferase/glucosamine-1-phosphate acetyltransferase [Deltaproteobacteria bacterium]
MSKFCVVILAAGEGKRMKSRLPKVMHPVCGVPMINHVVAAARAVKPARVTVVIGGARKEVRGVLEKGVGVAVQNVPQGTADAVRCAVKDIPAAAKDVVILYGDTPLIRKETVEALYAHHRDNRAACTVLTTHVANPRGYGRILRDPSGQVIGIIEDKEATQVQRAIREVNTGMYVFAKDDLLEGLGHVHPAPKTGEYYLTDVLGWLFQKGRKVEACVAEDSEEVAGVNSQMDLLAATHALCRRVLERHLEAGVGIMDAHTVFIDPSATIGEGTTVYPFTYIEAGVVIGRHCSVGPFCHLRTGAVLEDDVSVGNYTEIKNSRLGKGTFMRHVSYLGDTSVGKGVNIGAGTVVANFDGRKKNRTAIGDKAFIGCDAVLIAPVTVGKNAVVGAGAVVPRGHNVADRSVVAGVPARPLRQTGKQTRTAS